MGMNLQEYRASEKERLRIQDLLRLLPDGGGSILEIGVRDGHHTHQLATRFEQVTALDLEKPDLDLPNVTPVAGDVTNLEFPDSSFDVVLCAEVLEHVPKLRAAASEITRVARHKVVIGTPFRQDTRLARSTCSTCGRINPPFGHINVFDESRLVQLFGDLEVEQVSFVGQNRDRTNVLSAWLCDLGGNPWGTYGQSGPCVHCGARLKKPATARSLGQRLCTRLAGVLNAAQRPLVRPTPTWIHILFQKPSEPATGNQAI